MLGKLDPLEVLKGTFAYQLIAHRLLDNYLAMHGKKGEPNLDRPEMNRLHGLATQHGWTLAAAARELSLDTQPVTDIITNDKLWEWPEEKECFALFTKAIGIAKSIETHARIECVRAGISLAEYSPEAATSKEENPPKVSGDQHADIPQPNASTLYDAVISSEDVAVAAAGIITLCEYLLSFDHYNFDRLDVQKRNQFDRALARVRRLSGKLNIVGTDHFESYSSPFDTYLNGDGVFKFYWGSLVRFLKSVCVQAEAALFKASSIDRRV